ncbi:MAG: histidine phosphatase family protein [Anaerobutyricum hallii]
MKIYLMRHGETKWNKRSKLQGQVDIPLAPKGIEQAEMTSEGMKDIPFDHIFFKSVKEGLQDSTGCSKRPSDRDCP